MPQIHRSEKKIKDLTEVVGMKKFIFPRQLANDVNPTTLKPCILIQVNLKRTYIPCEEQVEVDNDIFCVMKDAGMVSPDNTFEVGGGFNPLKPYEQG